MNYNTLPIKHLKFVERRLEYIKSENKSSNKFGWGIVLGLIMGIMGNLYITILNNSWLKDFKDSTNVILILICTILICGSILLTLKDDREFKKKDKEIDEELNLVRLEIENKEKE